MDIMPILSPVPSNHAAIATSTQMDINHFHCIMGHLAYPSLKHMLQHNMISGIKVEPTSTPTFCHEYTKSKSIQLLLPSESFTRATKYGEQIHTDLWGPARVNDLHGK